MKRSLETLVEDPSNVRKHDQRNLDAIKGSLKRFGQQKPIVVDKDGVIIAGNGTYEAAKSLGWTELEVKVSELVGSDRTAYAIADNRTAELAEWDDDSLAETLEALRLDDDIDELVTGFSESEIDDMLERFGRALDDTTAWAGVSGLLG